MEHIQADVVALGTGGTGMAAAVTAAEAGAKVVILEKRPFPGGASNTPVGFALTIGRIAGKPAPEYLKKLGSK